MVGDELGEGDEEACLEGFEAVVLRAVTAWASVRGRQWAGSCLYAESLYLQCRL